jgi:hypothetical protein
VDYSWTAKNCNVRDFLLLMGTVEVAVITVWNTAVGAVVQGGLSLLKRLTLLKVLY